MRQEDGALGTVTAYSPDKPLPATNHLHDSFLVHPPPSANREDLSMDRMALGAFLLQARVFSRSVPARQVS